MASYKRLLSNTAILGVGTFASKVLVFLLMPFYTAVLSSGEFGTADLVAQTANLIIPLASVGICDGLFRFTLDARQEQRKQIFTASMLILALGSVGMVAILSVVSLIDSAFRESMALIALYVIASNFHSSCAHYLRAKGKTALFAMQGIINTVLTILLNILFLVVFHMGSTGYVLSVVVADFLLTIGLFVCCRLWRDLSFKNWKGAVLKDLLKFSIPYIPTTMMWLITSVSDRYIVAAYCGVSMQGLYAAASKIPTLILLVSGIFIEAWHFSTIKDVSEEERASFFGTVFRSYTAIMFMGASVLIAMTQIFTRILLADSYFSSWQFVPVLVIAMLFSSFSAFFGSVYFMEKKSVLSMLTAMAGAVINVALNFLLIPKHGAQGAAVATLISYLATYAIRAYDTARYVRFPQRTYRLVINGLLLLAQAYTMIENVPYWQIFQIGIVCVVLVFNGKGIVQALCSVFGKYFAKKKKNI